jgi:hypothetical protein
MKMTRKIYFFLLLTIPYIGIAQHYNQINSNKSSSKDYSPPRFPGGYDSLILYIENNIHIIDTNTISGNNVYDAIVTFTVTDSGTITNIKNKGSDVNGFIPAIQKCFTNMPIWIPAKSKKKNVSSVDQLTFTYTIAPYGIKIIKKAPLYVCNYEKKEKNTEKYIIAITILAVCLYFIVY